MSFSVSAFSPNITLDSAGTFSLLRLKKNKGLWFIFQCDNNVPGQGNRYRRWRYTSGHLNSWEIWKKIPVASFTTQATGPQCWRNLEWVRKETKSAFVCCHSDQCYFCHLHFCISLPATVLNPVYSLVQTSPTTKLQIDGQDVDVTR